MLPSPQLVTSSCASFSWFHSGCCTKGHVLKCQDVLGSLYQGVTRVGPEPSRDCHMQPCTACGLSHWQPEESTSSGRRHLLTCMDLSVFMGFWKTVILRGWKRRTTTKTQWVSDWKETVQVSPLQSRKFSPGRVRDPTYAVQQLKMDWN